MSKFSNVLIFGQNVHKVEQKCRETVLRVWETILRVKIFSTFQNFQMCLFTKMYKKLTKSVGRPFLGSPPSNFFSKRLNFQVCLIFTKMYKKFTKSVGKPF